MRLKLAWQAIEAIQQEFDVNSLYLDGSRVWPAVREIFIRPFVDFRLSTFREIFGDAPHYEPVSIAQLRKDPSPLVSYAYDLYDHQCGQLTLLARSAEMLCPVEVDVMFFDVLADYDRSCQSDVRSRSSDDLLEGLAREGSSYRKFVSCAAQAPLVRFAHEPVFVVEPEVRSRQDWGVDQSRELRQGLEKLIELSMARGFDVKGPVDWVMERLCRMFARARHFEVLLKRYKPRLVVISSYSHPEKMALIRACWRCDIEIIDVQHGFMGPCNPVAALQTVPQGGYDLLPHIFWCWGEWSARELRESLGSGSQWHRVLVGGRPGSIRHPIESLGNSDSEKLKRLKALKASGRRLVVIAWQPDIVVHNTRVSELPQVLLEAMREAPSDWLWALRLHPRSRHLLEFYENYLVRAGAKNFDIELATDLPINTVLDETSVLLTSYSTVALEANARGVPVVVIDEFGAFVMKDVVQSGGASVALSCESLLEFLSRAEDLSQSKLDYFSEDVVPSLLSYGRV